MKILNLTNSNEIALIDDTDFDRVSKFSWYLRNTDTSTGIYRTASPQLHLANFIMQNLDNICDHKDRNIFNNQKTNLRFANKSQNAANSKMRITNRSGYKGVYWNKALNKWHAQITVDFIKNHLGYFEDKEKAARAYNKAARKYFGEFAYQNEVLDAVVI